MSIKQPKPLQIRLPFSVPKPNKSTKTETKICGICRKKESKYVCPRCNILYCSLDCFRDEIHSQCSEPFYKSTVLSSIATDPKAGLEEKKGMMEMLKRFEKSQIEGEGSGSGEVYLAQLEKLELEENEEDELIEKLKDVDLDLIDTNQLFHLLPQHHKDAFLSALKNPESEETKELLEEASKSENGHSYIPDVLPWWEDPDVDDDTSQDGEGEEGEEGKEGEEEEVDTKMRTALTPVMIPKEILESISPPEDVGKKLIYNAVAICIAYLHILLSLRLPSLSPDYLKEAEISNEQIHENIGQLVPFLVDSKSTIRYENLSSAWGNVWDKIIEDLLPSQPDISTLHHLLSILPNLVHPPITTPLRPKLFYLLSDLYSIYSTPRTRSNIAISKKLAFYLKALEPLERSAWLALERQVENELNKLQDDAENDDLDAKRKENLRVL